MNLLCVAFIFLAIQYTTLAKCVVEEGPTVQPTEFPSLVPTIFPTLSPSATPSISPTLSPSATPSISSPPTIRPTRLPTVSPSISLNPTVRPTQAPTVSPSISLSPYVPPTVTPTIEPTVAPSTRTPSCTPTVLPTTSTPTIGPSRAPTVTPTTSQIPSRMPTPSPSILPTPSPSTKTPTVTPTANPSYSQAPSAAPSISLAPNFSYPPTRSPTRAPTQPTVSPTRSPTASPSFLPSLQPSVLPTLAPTEAPSETPTLSPSEMPSVVPTISPSSNPTAPLATEISLVFTQDLQNMTVQDFALSSVQSTFTTAVAATVPNLNEEDVSILSASSLNTAPSLRTIVLLASQGVRVKYQIQLFIESLGFSSPTKAKQYITQTLKDAAKNGVLLSNLQAAAVQYNASGAYDSAGVGSLTLASYTENGSDSSDSNAWEDWNWPFYAKILLLGGFVFLVLLICLLYYCYIRRNATPYGGYKLSLPKNYQKTAQKKQQGAGEGARDDEEVSIQRSFMDVLFSRSKKNAGEAGLIEAGGDKVANPVIGKDHVQITLPGDEEQALPASQSDTGRPTKSSLKSASSPAPVAPEEEESTFYKFLAPLRRVSLSTSSGLTTSSPLPASAPAPYDAASTSTPAPATTTDKQPAAALEEEESTLNKFLRQVSLSASAALFASPSDPEPAPAPSDPTPATEPAPEVAMPPVPPEEKQSKLNKFLRRVSLKKTPAPAATSSPLPPPAAADADPAPTDGTTLPAPDTASAQPPAPPGDKESNLHKFLRRVSLTGTASPPSQPDPATDSAPPAPTPAADSATVSTTIETASEVPPSTAVAPVESAPPSTLAGEEASGLDISTYLSYFFPANTSLDEEAMQAALQSDVEHKEDGILEVSTATDAAALPPVEEKKKRKSILSKVKKGLKSLSPGKKKEGGGEVIEGTETMVPFPTEEHNVPPPADPLPPLDPAAASLTPAAPTSSTLGMLFWGSPSAEPIEPPEPASVPISTEPSEPEAAPSSSGVETDSVATESVTGENGVKKKKRRSTFSKLKHIISPSKKKHVEENATENNETEGVSTENNQQQTLPPSTTSDAHAPPQPPSIF